MFKGGEIKIIKIRERNNGPSVIIFEYIDEEGNPLEYYEGRFGMETRDSTTIKDFMVNFTPFEPVNPMEYGAEEFGADGISTPTETMLDEECGLCGDDLILVDTGQGQIYKTCLGEYCGYILPMNAEEFESEFSKGDLKKLKKYIDFPTRWINKETAPTSETKRRKAKNKFVGTLPAQKGIESMKHDIYRKTPTWFKGIQLGILATIFGAMYVGETKKKGKK